MGVYSQYVRGVWWRVCSGCLSQGCLAHAEVCEGNMKYGCLGVQYICGMGVNSQGSGVTWLFVNDHMS